MARINPDSAAVAALCREHGIRELSFLNSMFRADLQPESDLNILIEFDPDVQIGFFRFMDLCDQLQELLGSKVDLLTKSMLSPFSRDEALAMCEVLYVRQG